MVAVEDLLQQEADIAIRMVRPSQSALLSRRIGKITLGFHAHRRYLERHGVPSSLAELPNHRLIGFDRQLAYIRDILKERPDLAGIGFDFRADSNLVQLAAIRAGLGIGMCQHTFAVRDPELAPQRAVIGQIDFRVGCGRSTQRDGCFNDGATVRPVKISPETANVAISVRENRVVIVSKLTRTPL